MPRCFHSISIFLSIQLLSQFGIDMQDEDMGRSFVDPVHLVGRIIAFQVI